VLCRNLPHPNIRAVFPTSGYQRPYEPVHGPMEYVVKLQPTGGAAHSPRPAAQGREPAPPWRWSLHGGPLSPRAAPVPWSNAHLRAPELAGPRPPFKPGCNRGNVPRPAMCAHRSLGAGERQPDFSGPIARPPSDFEPRRNRTRGSSKASWGYIVARPGDRPAEARMRAANIFFTVGIVPGGSPLSQKEKKIWLPPAFSGGR